MPSTRQALQTLRHAVRDKKHVATCLGFGPRFLHSTGQAYKGGPNSGVFLQITCDDAVELPVPGQKYTFGIVKAAQARGDFQVLAERGRRALRVHLGSNLKAGWQRCRQPFKRLCSFSRDNYCEARKARDIRQDAGNTVRSKRCNWEWWDSAAWART